MARALRDALLAALVALVLAIPLVGFQAVDTGGPLGLALRFDWVAGGVAAVFLGRLCLAAIWQRRAATRGAEDGAWTRLDRRFPRLGGWLLLGFVAAAIVLPATDLADRRSIDLGTQVLIYVMLGWGLNVVVGLAGLLDLGYVAFYAVGAYSYAILARDLGLSFWACLPLAGGFAALFGILLGFPVLRLRGDYLAIVTLGFGEMVRLVLINWQSFTGGPNGLTSIPRPSFFGLPFTSDPPDGQRAFHQVFGLEYASQHRLLFAYYLILALALVTHALTTRLRSLPVGRAWEALREDEIACRALGINPTTVKLSAFAIGAMFGGFAGSFFATRQGFISPESFTFGESATILAIVVLGGMGSQIGVVIAAAILVLLPEFARDLAHYRMLIFGAAMVAIMVWRPRGLVSHREPTVKLA